MLRSGRPSGIPVKTVPNNSLRQAKVNQPTQHEGVGEGTSKSLNNMVVSDATSLKIVPFIVLNIMYYSGNVNVYAVGICV
jgi:hypothetical protein